jgi:hypothetical protein
VIPLLGVTSTTAQTGQDERCAAFTRQAHGLYLAAVSEGCFDGVESQACDDLTTNWIGRCRSCEGPAPWEGGAAIGPCAAEVGSAVELNSVFEGLGAGGTITASWSDAMDEEGDARGVAPGLMFRVNAVSVGGLSGLACLYARQGPLAGGGGVVDCLTDPNIE